MTPMSGRPVRSDTWDDAEDDAPLRALSREEVQALREADPPLSPWRVVAMQAVVGGVVAVLAGLITAERSAAVSALWGAAAVVLPAALMARGMTRRLSRMSPGLAAVSVVLWELTKLGATVVMLMLAPRWVPALSWPALLSAMASCIAVYWFALLWRGRKG
jgi:ATP synthase protein I